MFKSLVMAAFPTIWNVFLPVPLTCETMSLHDYLTEVLGSKASIKVLKTLVRYRGKVFTMRDLARTAGLSHPEVALVARTLEKRGVVRLQPVGRAQQVILNEESYVLNSIVWPAIKAEEDTLSAILSTIKPFFDDKSIRSVAVFGSAARGLEGKQSDIDIFIVADNRELASERVAAASAETVSKFGFGLSPLIMDEATFARKKNKDLGRSILESYRMVRGKDLRKIGDVQARQ
jgi:predicted nucleotidyltransferase